MAMRVLINANMSRSAFIFATWFLATMARSMDLSAKICLVSVLHTSRTSPKAPFRSKERFKSSGCNLQSASSSLGLFDGVFFGVGGLSWVSSSSICSIKRSRSSAESTLHVFRHGASLSADTNFGRERLVSVCNGASAA